MSEQDYITGTTVIKNLIDRDATHPDGTTDPEHLSRAETFKVSRRIEELRRAPIAGAFTFGHMRQIHKYLFQDVYAWAGEPRQVPMQKLGTSYADPTEMGALLRQQYTRLAEQDGLRGINDHAEFTRRFATFWAEINHGHAFREGNTRSQAVFFEQLAHEAGWKLDLARLSPHHPQSLYTSFVSARFEHQRLRTSEAVSDHQASLKLAEVLGHLLEADSSPEGGLRRGAKVAERSSTNARPRVELHARNPELREMTIDPFGLHEDRSSSGEALEL